MGIEVIRTSLFKDMRDAMKEDIERAMQVCVRAFVCLCASVSYLYSCDANLTGWVECTHLPTLPEPICLMCMALACPLRAIQYRGCEVCVLYSCMAKLYGPRLTWMWMIG